MAVVDDLGHASSDAPSEDYGRQPPQDLAAEQSVLGGMLLSKDAIADVVQILARSDYYRPAHQTIHDAILDLYGRGEPADPITVASQLVKSGDITRVGGPSYLHTLVNQVPTAANAEYYAEIVHERAVTRRLVEAGTWLVQQGYSGQGNADTLAAMAVTQISEAVESREAKDGFTLPSESVIPTLELVQASQDHHGLTGVSTGFADLDSLTSGLQPGQVIVVAGRPGMGKTTLAMDFARACSIRDGKPSAFISLEMNLVTELNMRILSAEGRVALHHLRSGGMTDEDWPRLATASERYQRAPLYVSESARTLLEIQAGLRRLKHRAPDLALVVIDYLQLVESGGRRAESRQQEVSEISRKIKLLAKELNLPIVLLSQLNRNPEMRADKRPMVSDLRESGSVEQDADMVILLYRPDAYEEASPRAGEAELIVGKHRNGPNATISVAFQGHYSRFVDMATS